MQKKLLLSITILASLVGLLAGIQFLVNNYEIENEENYIEIEMTAKQWEFSKDVIVVKKDQTILLKITSLDVPHGLYIEDYDLAVFIPPGETVELKFNAEIEGEFEFYCNVFCGEGHPRHRSMLIVEN
ncbi:MAG: cupredoxin domain-containing protein [Thermoproteota archaeon]